MKIADVTTGINKQANGHEMDVVTNNVGYGHHGPIELVIDANLRQQFDTNDFWVNVGESHLFYQRCAQEQRE